jgi:hypothetical protein
MSRSSQKPTNSSKWVVKDTDSDAVRPKSESWTVRSETSGRFFGMSKNIEKVAALIIPGYKTRG